MNNSNYVYNNEALGAITIAAVLRYINQMSYAKALLILPFLMHLNTVSFLKNSATKVRSVEELIAKKPQFFANFNRRYESLIPISINSIFILKEMRVIEISKGKLNYSADNHLDLDNSLLGKRVENIIKASEKLSKLLEEDASNLYLQLRIEL